MQEMSEDFLIELVAFSCKFVMQLVMSFLLKKFTESYFCSKNNLIFLY